MMFMFSAGRKSAGLALKRFIYRGIKIPLAFRALLRTRFAFLSLFLDFHRHKRDLMASTGIAIARLGTSFRLRAGFAELSIEYFTGIEQSIDEVAPGVRILGQNNFKCSESDPPSLYTFMVNGKALYKVDVPNGAVNPKDLRKKVQVDEKSIPEYFSDDRCSILMKKPMY